MFYTVDMNICITGAARGIGYDAARRFAQLGHDVLLTTHTQEQATAVRAACKDLPNITVQKLDITKSADWSILTDALPDVLIHNAGFGVSGPLLHLSMEDVRHAFEVNVFGTLGLTQEVGKRMVERGSGRIVSVSSVAGVLTLPYLGAYSATKHSLEAFADALRREVDGSGVQVSVIQPGAIATGFNERMVHDHRAGVSGAAKEGMNRLASTLTSGQHATDTVVDAYVHAATASRPRARYTAPMSAAIIAYAVRALPTRLVDWLIARRIQKHTA